MALNSATWPPGRPARTAAEYGPVGGEVADGVVTPVVGQPPVEQERLGTLWWTGQQLDRGHPEVDQVGDGRLVAEPGVGAAQLGRDLGWVMVKPLTCTS